MPNALPPRRCRVVDSSTVNDIDHTPIAVTPVAQLLRHLSESSTTIQLIEHVLDALHDLIPSDSVIFDEVSLDGGRTRGATRPANLVSEWADMMPTFERWVMQSPNVQYFRDHPTGSARRWSDGDVDSFRATELYREFMAPLGIHFQLSFTLPSNRNAQRAFILNRGDRDFSDDEVAICDEIAPYLSAIFTASQQRVVGLVDGLNAAGAWNAVIVDQTSRVVSATRTDVSKAPDELELDPVLRDWVSAQLGQRDLRRTIDPQSSQITLTTGLVVDAQLLPDAAGSHVLITSQPSSVQLDPDLMDRLSGRQREVVEQLVAGGTNQQIGRRLGISVETVKKHLSAVYRELGVADRASAVAAARRRVDGVRQG